MWQFQRRKYFIYYFKFIIQNYIYIHTHIYIGNSKEESIYNILFQVYYLKVLCVYIKRSVFSLGPPGIAGIGTILTVDRVQHCYFLSEKAEV